MVVVVMIAVSVITVGTVIASVITLIRWLRIRKIMSNMSQQEIELRREFHLGWEDKDTRIVICPAVIH